jgi:putative phage-type endonuclease
MLISDLEDLQDILDTLVFEDPPSIFDEDSALELIETALHLMEEYTIDNPTAITEPDFHDTLLEEIKDVFYIQMEELILHDDYIEDDLDELLLDALNIYISTFHPERSLNENTTNTTNITNTTNASNKNEENHVLEQKILTLQSIPQPVQRTDEWYKFRWNLITASNAWKAFESQSTINQLIYEKCQPIKSDNMCDDIEGSAKMVNTNSPLHWGQKYEPLSVMLYEKRYNTSVGDFGCIPHPTYKFVGASPDGINIDPIADRYGRMLEIKNVVSREINGIPKKEYWIQMQLQMEVCDLDECDFLETKFTEYPDYNAYQNDILSSDENTKGIIIHFHKKDGSPFYSYKPLDVLSEEDISKWEEDVFNTYQSEPYNYIYLKFIYWKLERFSCVLVLRNKEWFKNNIPQLEKVWKIIEEERVTGYEHRAPNKKPKKDTTKPYIDFSKNNETQGCLLKFNKIIKIDIE